MVVSAEILVELMEQNAEAMRWVFISITNFLLAKYTLKSTALFEFLDV